MIAQCSVNDKPITSCSSDRDSLQQTRISRQDAHKIKKIDRLFIDTLESYASVDAQRLLVLTHSHSHKEK
jgi:hypothetical protein